MKNTSRFIEFVGLLAFVVFPGINLAHSSPTGALEEFRFIISTGIDSFVNDLNENGKLGYRLEKSVADAAQQRFRPVKILFARQGLLDFSVSILTERNLKDSDTAKTEYRFLKKSSGLPDDVNDLAAQGFRFIGGRRVGMIGMALLGKQTNDATTYTFIDAKKYAKEFDKTIALGDRYEAVMMGDLTCGSSEVINERLVSRRIPTVKNWNTKLKLSQSHKTAVQTRVR